MQTVKRQSKILLSDYSFIFLFCKTKLKLVDQSLKEPQTPNIQLRLGYDK